MRLGPARLPLLSISLEGLSSLRAWVAGKPLTFAATTDYAEDDGPTEEDPLIFVEAIHYFVNGHFASQGDDETTYGWPASSPGDFAVEARAILNDGSTIDTTRSANFRVLSADRIPRFATVPSGFAGSNSIRRKEPTLAVKNEGMGCSTVTVADFQATSRCGGCSRSSGSTSG